MVDVIIIGSGPAGISASLYTIRANLSTTVLSIDESVLASTASIQNYYGFENISGKELLKKGEKQCLALGGTILHEQVIGISYDNHFEVKTSKQTIQGRAVIIATGSKRKKLSIADLENFEGKGVSYCAICDAFFFKGKDVAVLGSSDYALGEVKELIGICKSVTLLTNGEKTTAHFPAAIKIQNKKIASLDGDIMLEKILFDDDSQINVSGLFVALGNAGADDLAKKIGIPTDGKKIIVDENMATMLPGLYACGDCIKGIQQIATAVGEGCTAAMSAISFLRKNKS